MMAACLAEGETVLENAAREPEVVDLARCLEAMGARIRGQGTDVIVIQGVGRLEGADHSVMPDRIEAGTFLAAAAATRGNVTLTHAPVASLDAVVEKLREAGAEISAAGDALAIRMAGRPRSVSVRTAPYPGVPHRHAGAVHGAQHDRLRHRPRHGDDLREPLHARAGAAPARGADRHRGQHRRRARRGAAQRGDGHGHGPARLREPGDRRASWPRARPWSTASTTSTAATSASRRSSSASAPA